MEITEIKREKKHLTKVVFDTQKSVLLDSDYLNELCLAVGDTVTERELDEFIKQSEYIRAKSRALWFLDRADHSEKALYEKIIRGGISANAAAQAIARLKELGLLDDCRYAERLAERMSEANVSKREAYMKLVLKGIPTDTVKQVLQQTDFDEAAQIKALIEKKYRLKLQLHGGAQKVYAALVRKGFSYGAVRDALKEYNEESEYYGE